jgi:hypothetical protein
MTRTPTSAWHRVKVVDADARVGDCSMCGTSVPLRRRFRRGAVEWSCMGRHLQYSGSSGNVSYSPPHRRHLGERCERCEFLPVHRAQLDAHHRDHNHSNNDAANIATLCANCHRLEHIEVAA